MPKSKSLTEKKWFQTTQGILTLGGAAIGLVIGVVTLWPKPEVLPSRQFAEILVDSSEGMGGAFDGSTKMEAARREIANLFESGLSLKDGLALRKFGGTCGPTDTELLLGFEKAARDSIDKAVAKLTPSGQNSLVDGIAQATGDFSGVGRDNPKRIIVMTGGGSRCDQNIDNLSSKLAQFKAAGGTGVDLHYIGLALAPEDQEKISAIAVKSGGEVQYVNTHKELEQALHQIVVIEPSIVDADTTIEILNSVVGQLNSASQSLNSKNYDAADASLREAQDTWHKSDGSFASLKARPGDNLQPLIQKAAQERDLQKQMFSTIADLIQSAKSDKPERFNDVAAKYQELVGRYNQNIAESNELVKNLGGHGR